MIRRLRQWLAAQADATVLRTSDDGGPTSLYVGPVTGAARFVRLTAGGAASVTRTTDG